ncbi:hypothetical protein PINS_up016408 [Pythium insidiosum]|nr:hypothetical protein PINS_up016408 [Pythium insidiosum]
MRSQRLLSSRVTALVRVVVASMRWPTPCRLRGLYGVDSLRLWLPTLDGVYLQPLTRAFAEDDAKLETFLAEKHRFYGKSYPTSDMSLETLRFLTSEQALADLARFHTFLADHYGFEGAPYVAFGCSYPGNLAAWVNLKYPALFAGTVASSAPLLCEARLQRVHGRRRRAAVLGGGDCYDRVESSIRAA